MTEQEYYSDLGFIQRLMNDPKLSSFTKKQYLKNLQTMTDKFFSQKVSIGWILTHPNEFKRALQIYGKNHHGRVYKTLSQASLEMFVRTLVCIITPPRSNGIYPDILKIWKGVEKEIHQPIEEYILDNKPTERQEKAFVPFPDICRIRDTLPEGSMIRLLISIYTMIKPLRSDFNSVKIYNSQPPTTEQGNYIVLNQTPRLVVQQYKTSEVYGKLETFLPKELIHQILLSFQMNPRQYLFVSHSNQPMTKANFNQWANRELKKVFNERFSINSFRHAYASRPEIQNMIRREKFEIARGMGHSIDQNDRYRFQSPVVKRQCYYR